MHSRFGPAFACARTMCARARLFVFSGAWIRACCLVSSGRIVKPGGSRNLASEPIHADSRSRRRWAIGTSTARRSTQTRCTSVAPSRPHTRARRKAHARACTQPMRTGKRTHTHARTLARTHNTHAYTCSRALQATRGCTSTHAHTHTRTHTQARTRCCKHTNPHTRTHALMHDPPTHTTSPQDVRSRRVASLART